jgi:hypothetical protein
MHVHWELVCLLLLGAFFYGLLIATPSHQTLHLSYLPGVAEGSRKLPHGSTFLLASGSGAGDLIGSGASQEQAIVGETPNLAARLQGIAEPNSVVIAESTRRLVGNLFELEDLGAGPRIIIEAAQIEEWRMLKDGFDGLIASAERSIAAWEGLSTEKGRSAAQARTGPAMPLSSCASRPCTQAA